MVPLASVYYPVVALPRALQIASAFIPPSYAFEAMRGIIRTGTFSSHNALIGIALALAYLLCAYWFFMHVFRRAIKTGLIARFSAEEVSY